MATDAAQLANGADDTAQADTVPIRPRQARQGGSPNDLESLLARIHQLAGCRGAAAAAPAATDGRKSTIPTGAAAAAAASAHDAVRRPASTPTTTTTSGARWNRSRSRKPGITEGQLEHLVLKCLGACGDMSGRDLSEQHAVPFRLLEPVLQAMKLAQLVAFRGSAPMNDFVYQLTDIGRERAKKLAEHCSYFGAAPVPLAAYCASVGRAEPHQAAPDAARPGAGVSATC